MRLAHLSDLHLGFRAYGRVERGADMRERDVAVAFERAVNEVLRVAPEVVVVSGDVFDRPNPPASAVVALARSLEQLRAALPDTPVLMVAGPRDTPRRPADPGALAVLDTLPNVEAATGLMRSVVVERLDLHACLVSHRAATKHPPAQPEADPRMRWNVLVLHAKAAEGGQDGVRVDPDEWSYVALGGEHRRRVLGSTVGYAGSLERVALDPWDEAGDEKGFVLVDLEKGEADFHRIPGRPVAALAPIDVRGADAERIRRRVREVTDEVPGGIDDKIVRLRLRGAHPFDLLALQGEQLRQLRQRALHLTVEVSPSPSGRADAWLAADAPTLVRDALLEELERDGFEGPAVRARVEELTAAGGGELGGDAPVGALDALDGIVPGLGRISTSISPGLTGVIGGDGRARTAVLDLLVTAGRGVGGGALRSFWAGEGGETLDGGVRLAVAAVAESRGLGLLDDVLRRAGAGEVSGPPLTPDRTEPDGSGAVRVDPDLVAAELRAADRELRALRADAAEVDGDLEVATMDWHRERQDAETTLQAYRDQAHELRRRLRRIESSGPEAACPTCGRPLESHYDEVLAELREAYEGVVQDGSWWRSRWEQLELKPEFLRDLERRSVQLHAAVEASSERVELLKARLGELGLPPESEREGDGVGGEASTVVRALRRLREARLSRAREMLLDRASRFVCRISGGRILAVGWSSGAPSLEGDLAPLGPLSEEDLAAGLVAVRLAAASLVAAGGRVLGSLPLSEPFDRLGAEARIRTVILAHKLTPEIPRIILVTDGDAVDARPEEFDSILEVREDASGVGPALRPASAGTGFVRLGAPETNAATFRT